MSAPVTIEAPLGGGMTRDNPDLDLGDIIYFLDRALLDFLKK